MAQNTFRKNIPKEPVKDKSEEKTPSETTSRFKLESLKDPRIRLIFGLFLIFASVFGTVAIFSFLFTGNADQSVVEAIGSEELRDSGKEAENWLGLSGAVVSYILVNKAFGLPSILLMPLIFLLGYQIVFRHTLYNLRSAWRYSLFFTFWLSLTLGYFCFLSDSDILGDSLGGAIGYELSMISHEMIGYGTFFLLILGLLAFVIIRFNITSLSSPARKKEEGNVIIDEGKTNTEDLDEVWVEDEELSEKELREDEADLLPDNWKVGEKPANKPLTKPELELDIEDLTAITSVPPIPVDSILPSIPIEKPKTAEDVAALPPYDPTLDLARYQYPTLDLMNDYGENKVQVTKEELESNKDRIVETLSNFSIGIASIKATIGPTVTLYEIVPDAGVKISKIKNLEDDIALSLSALGIRIIAPMPGKGTIGIEVPNKKKEMVTARSVLSSEKFTKSDMELPIVFGKTISNEVFVADLTKMPHLLMAGATGMGKSVGINMLLTSLVYKKHPAQLKFVLVDPKKVELSLYNKIERHFLAKLPDSEEAIITDTKKVVHTLNSLCIEMDTRYSLLKDAGCRNIKEYNPKFVERKLNPNEGHHYLPYIVVVIDELADLMITAGKEVETPIARIAQLARAVGIHLVLATQRPSVNVITGVIKANFPARLSFRVASKIDSRTILDEGGADQLVGQGDMLMKINSDTIRLQCAFVDTPEVERVCDFIGEQTGYATAYMLPEFYDEDGDGGQKEVDLSERDSLFDDAARVIVAHQQGSTSLLQRKMKLGYNRAGRIMDQLEAAGVVGPFNGSKQRDVLIKDEYSLEQFLKQIDER